MTAPRIPYASLLTLRGRDALATAGETPALLEFCFRHGMRRRRAFAHVGLSMFLPLSAVETALSIINSAKRIVP